MFTKIGWGRRFVVGSFCAFCAFLRLMFFRLVFSAVNLMAVPPDRYDMIRWRAFRGCFRFVRRRALLRRPGPVSS